MEYIGEKELNHKLDDFKNHLKHADRMILSAKFGDGKSFFLQKIREDRERFSEYEFITIYPVNYVVAQNEDIFEYIKRDILIQLVKLNLIEKIDLKKLLTSVFSIDNFKEVLFFLVSSIPEYGPVIKKLLDKVIDISKKYNDDKETYKKFFDSFKVQKGGLYEDDAYTQMIKEAINLLKVGYINEKGEMIQKKPVLIIEDLDRLDPAHLFRILNVISAHIDDAMKPDKTGNKFGFSNIVIVMDYDTTKHIFEHFYGKNASYEGYMSKFLAEEPFKYSIIELALPKLINKIAQTIGISERLLQSFKIVNRKLLGFSMRDIVRLYDFDVQSRIYSQVLVISDEIKMSTQLPIFKLLVYMSELGMSIGDMDEVLSIKSRYEVAEYLKLVFPLYVITKSYTDQTFITNNGKLHVLSKKDNDGVINSIKTDHPSYNPVAPPYINSCFNSIASQVLPKITGSFDIASLTNSLGFTIQGYQREL